VIPPRHTVGKATERLFLSAGTDESLYSIPGNLNTVSIGGKKMDNFYIMCDSIVIEIENPISFSNTFYPSN